MRLPSRKSSRTLLLAAILLGFAGSMTLGGCPLVGPASGGSNPPDGASIMAAGSLASWNPNVACTADLATIADILGPSYPSQSLRGGRYQRNATLGGIPHARALSPPCTITNESGSVLSSLVQIDGVYLSSYGVQTNDCSTRYKNVNGGGPYPNNATFCDDLGYIFAMGTTAGFMQIEVDQDWLAKGYCGSGVPSCDDVALAEQVSNGTTSVDVQGFVYWDGENWELHPFTAWRVSAPPPPPPDFEVGADSTSMRVALGTAATSTITLASLNGFSGTVVLTVSIQAVNVPPLVPTTYPTASLSPDSVTLVADGIHRLTLTVSASLLTTPGTYSVTVTATDGALTHSVTITVDITVV